jgi:hypothetical protein
LIKPPRRHRIVVLFGFIGIHLLQGDKLRSLTSFFPVSPAPSVLDLRRCCVAICGY